MKPHDSIPLSDFHEYNIDEMQARAAAFYADIKRRHSIREFSTRPVPREIIENCIRAAGTAPSGANHQPWHFVSINDPDIKIQVREQAEAEERAFYQQGRAGDAWLDALAPLGTDADKPYLAIAPWLIAIFAQRQGGVSSDEHQKNYYVRESVGIATGFLINALHHSGLATLTHTPKPMNFLNKICGRDKSEMPYILLITGYPAEGATVPAYAMRKKSLEEISTFM